MKSSIFILTLFLTATYSYAQLYTGKSTDKNKSFTCAVKINADSTVNFFYASTNHSFYAEYKGSIKKQNDTLHQISAKMTIGQFIMKALYSDTFCIQLDSAIARTLDAIEVEYADGKNRKQYQGYDKQGKPISCITIPINKKLYNSTKGSDYLNITVNRKNQIYDNWLTFRIPYGAAASFTSDKKEDFDTILKGSDLFISKIPDLGIGFKLKKKN